MAQDFNIPPSTQPPPKRNTATIVAIVLVVLLLCCCALVLVLWFTGDYILRFLDDFLGTNFISYAIQSLV